MMQVWVYDENNIYVNSRLLEFEEKLGLNMTTVSPISNCDIGRIHHRPRFDEENQIWVEDMTEEEIKKLEEDNKIDNCSPIPTNEELNNQLVETQKLCLSLQKQILLK